jgi:hypothetical protein
MAVASAVAAALDELRSAFPDARVDPVEDGQGGALVTVDPVPLGPPYVQADTWVGFHITHLHPMADIYPHHVRRDLSRIDGQPLGSATSESSFHNRPSIQLSRRSNRRDAETFTALLKLEHVIAWLLAK